MASKKPKKAALKTEINPNPKINPSSDMFFSQTLKVKKTHNMNFHHQIKPFEINIVRFGALNSCQRYFSFSTVKI